MKRPPPNPQWASLLMPLRIEVWITLAIATILVDLLHLLSISLRYYSILKIAKSIYLFFLEIIFILCPLLVLASNVIFRKEWIHIILAILLFMFCVIRFVYRGSLISYLSVNHHEKVYHLDNFLIIYVLSVDNT